MRAFLIKRIFCVQKKGIMWEKGGFMKNSLAIICSNYSSLYDHFNKSSDVDLMLCTDDGEQALLQIVKQPPDIVICDIIVKNCDGLALIEQIKGINSSIKVVVYTVFDSDEIIRLAKLRGADLFLVKPLPPETLEERILCLTDTTQPITEQSVGKIADLRISNVFLSAGIPPHIKGYSFLRTAVKLAIFKPYVINNITKELYPTIAEQFDTSASKVERAIRHAIEVAWNRGKIENLNSMLGVAFYSNTDKPTNGEFIALVADRLLQELRLGRLG